MKISAEQVRHVAQLARLTIDAAEVESVARQLADILAYVETLDEVDTQGVIPTAHALHLTNAFREDRVQTHIGVDRALANAPVSEQGCFVVPKVIG
jgi:aspartyl-tRNA(Asn)/glutamyl-tRNA(Gln) amidotransferase subunit C